MNLDEMQKYLTEVYPNTDIPIQFMINRIVSNSGLVATNYKNGAVQDDPFVEIISWSLAIFTRAEKSFWQELLLRYPNECYRCLEPVCICGPSGGVPRDVPVWKVKEERLSRGGAIINSILGKSYSGKSEKIPYLSVPPTLDQVSDMLARVYGRNEVQYQYNSDSFFVDVMRCCGRLADAMSKSDSDASRSLLTEHVLSQFAWMLGFWRLASRGRGSFSPTASFMQRYQLGCPVCSRSPCKCGDNRYNRLTSFDIVSEDTKTNDPRVEFRAQLKKLNALLQDASLDALPLEISKEDKISVLATLAKKREALQNLDKSTEAIGSIGKRIAALSVWVAEHWPFS